MMELAEHIEALLLENDCVIVPGLGGFIAHSTSAKRVEEENLFIPPARVLGFNPQLKLNDGILVQSYMEAYDTNFSDATKMVEKQVAELIALLHEEGKVELENIGELHYTIYNTYEFLPYNNKVVTPSLYGLDAFEMKSLSAIRQNKEEVLTPTLLIPEKKPVELKINRSFLRNAVAVAAAVIFFFVFSTPIQNTDIEKNNYAKLLPTEIFEKMEKQSLAMTPVVKEGKAEPRKIVAAQRPQQKVTADEAKICKPVAVKEIKISNPNNEVKPSGTKSPRSVASTQVSSAQKGNFYIIVTGGISLKSAQTIAADLQAQGYKDAKALNNDGKVRVSIMSYATRQEATKQLMKIRENEKYKNAWLLAL